MSYEVSKFHKCLDDETSRSQEDITIANIVSINIGQNFTWKLVNDIITPVLPMR